jgi:hypothetical protein
MGVDTGVYIHALTWGMYTGCMGGTARTYVLVRIRRPPDAVLFHPSYFVLHLLTQRSA